MTIPLGYGNESVKAEWIDLRVFLIILEYDLTGFVHPDFLHPILFKCGVDLLECDDETLQ